MKELIDEIKSSFRNIKTSEKTPVFAKKGFEPIKLSVNNFHDLKAKATEGAKICFIDGGNAELVAASNLSVHVIRTAAIIYKDKKKTFMERKEFYVLITFRNEEFHAKLISQNKEFVFNMKDEALKNGRSFAGVSRIGDFIRRLAELEMASSMIDKSNIIVLDGSLEEKFSHERNALSKLYKKADEKKVMVASVTKTNSLVTKSGHSVSHEIYNMKGGSWYYHPVAMIYSEDFMADMCFAKLHKRSRHAFRIDLHKGSFLDVCSALAHNSSDPVFPGYPYGLIEADRVARISNREKDYFITKLMVELGEDWKLISELQTTKNAHQVLDSIS